MLDLIYARIEIEDNILVLTPLSLLKLLRTSRNRSITILVRVPNGPLGAKRDIKRLFLTLKRDIEIVLISFSALAGIESNSSKDKESEADLLNATSEPKQNSIEPEQNSR